MTWIIVPLVFRPLSTETPTVISQTHLIRPTLASLAHHTPPPQNPPKKVSEFTKKPSRLAGGGATVLSGERGGDEAGGEVREVGVFVIELTILPRALVEVESVTQRIVLEIPGLVADPVAVEAADEGLPLRASDNLRPLSELLEGPNWAGPPPVVGLAPVPQRRR